MIPIDTSLFTSFFQVILKGFQIGTDQVIDFNQKKPLIEKRLYRRFLVFIPGLSKILL